MTLIDADALVKSIESAIEDGYVVTIGDVIATIEYAPTIEPVRCGECKYKPTDTGGHNYGQDLAFPVSGKCPCECFDPWYSWMPKDDWFCAYGERLNYNADRC